jgi:hypothetical protein
VFHQVFEGVNFSYFFDKEENQFMLYWRKYDIIIRLKDYDAFIFKQQIEKINSEPDKDVPARIERVIKIHFYFRYACPMPHFAEA